MLTKLQVLFIWILKVNDDKVMLDKTVADQVSSWKNSRGLTDEAVKGHSCSGNTCSYTQIGDAYICEKTGRVHGIHISSLYPFFHHDFLSLSVDV